MTWALFQPLVDLYNLPNNFNGKNGRKLLDAYPDYPVYATVLYFSMVFFLPGFLKRRNIRLELKWVTAVWNLTLSLISTVGAYYTLHLLYDYVFIEHGFHGTSCTHPFLNGGGGSGAAAAAAAAASTAESGKAAASALGGEKGKGHVVHTFISMTTEARENLLGTCYQGPKFFYIALFLYLKTPELLDTLFLILQDKPVSFLHWFHHILTAIYSWHAGYTFIPAGLFFTTMNYTVHSIMYFYFFLVVMGLRKKIRWFAPVITILQCLQMFFGMYITCYTYLQYWLGPTHKGELFYGFFHFVFGASTFLRAQTLSLVKNQTLLAWGDVPEYKMADHFVGCDTDATNLRMGVMMYGAYCVLFCVLFSELYLNKSEKKNSMVLVRKAKVKTEETNGEAKQNGDAMAGVIAGAVEVPQRRKKQQQKQQL